MLPQWPRRRPERPVDLPDELGRTGSERTTYAAAVQVRPFFGPPGPAGGQGGDAGAAGTEPGSGARGRHQAALGPTSLTGPPPGQGSPVAGLAHRPLGPTGASRPVLSAVGTAAQPFGRARHADGPAGSHEVARAFPPAHCASGQRAVETAVAQFTLAVVGTAGDLPLPSTARAGPLGPGRANRAQGLTDRPATSHRFDDPAACTSGSGVAVAAWAAEPAHIRSRELGVGAPAAGADRPG